MKIRYDFVTNSSSSSFILKSKDNKKYTIESVYQIVRKLYIEMYNLLEKIEQYDTEHEDSIELKKYKGGYIAVRHKTKEAEQELNKILGTEIYYGYMFNSDNEWTKCETYSDYVDYFSKKNISKPFRIGDFTDADNCNVDCKEMVDWYTDISDALECSINGRDEEFCIMCDCFNRCEEYTEFIKNNNIKEFREICALMLGTICIESYDGIIPSYVVQRLHQISDLSCEHMG